MTNKITQRTPRSSGSTKTRRNQCGGGKHKTALAMAIRKRITAQRNVDNETDKKDREKAENKVNTTKAALDIAEQNRKDAKDTKKENASISAVTTATRNYNSALNAYNTKQDKHTERQTTLTNANALVEELREPARVEAEHEQAVKDKKAQDARDVKTNRDNTDRFVLKFVKPIP